MWSNGLAFLNGVQGNVFTTLHFLDNWGMGPTSQSVCSQKPFPALWNVTPQLFGPFRMIRGSEYGPMTLLPLWLCIFRYCGYHQVSRMFEKTSWCPDSLRQYPSTLLLWYYTASIRYRLVSYKKVSAKKLMIHNVDPLNELSYCVTL